MQHCPSKGDDEDIVPYRKTGGPGIAVGADIPIGPHPSIRNF